MHIALSLLILAVLFLLSAFFSASETALFSLSKIEKRRVEQSHPYLSRWVKSHLEFPRRTLVTILIGNLVANTLATALVTLIVLEHMGVRYLSLILVGFTMALIFFAEIMPKTFAVKQNETVSLAVALPLRVFSLLFYPLRRTVRLITDFILRIILHDHREHSDQISEDELKTLVKIGEEEGLLDRQERYMLQKLLELGERQVREIMTPRISLAALDMEDPREKQIETMQKFHFMQLPVYQNSVDNLLGVISVQEFMLNLQSPLSSFLKQPLFVPESKRIDDLLSEFRAKNQDFAVCVDEYGGTAGVVTLEDIFEEIFGEFYDEYAKVENPIRPLGHQEFLVEAKIPLASFNEYFSTHLESEEASTLSGYLLEKMGEVPEKGKVLETPECEIRIQDVIRQRLIRTVIVRRIP
ncbi:MAG TPA: hemolysin family protein [bacterium]|nr:hemolysin family protein [bacterium]